MSQGRWRGTLGALLLAFAALYCASLPNDTKSEWFRTLARPDMLPRELERLIPFIWTTLFMLAGLGLAAVWASRTSPGWKLTLSLLFALQLALNLGYTFTFTRRFDLDGAFLIAVGLAAVTGLIVLLAAVSRVWVTALALTPYFVWVVYATEVTRQMARLNPAS